MTSTPTLDLVSMVYTGADDAAYAELSRLAELVGLDIDRIVPGESSRAGVLTFTSHGCAEGRVAASFHDLFAPYFAKGRVELSLRTDSGAILELMVAVGATLRGRVVGVLGSRGGLGVSTLAGWLARTLAGDGSVALVDADPVSPGIDMILTCQSDPGKRWSDISGHGALLAGQLVESLPVWKGVRVLSADERGAIPISGDLGARAISAVAQVNAWTVVDLPPRALVDGSIERTWLEWCDHALLCVSGDEVGLAGAQIALNRLGTKIGVTPIGVGVAGHGDRAHMETVLDTKVLAFRRQRGMVADADHGVGPGDRSRGSLAKDVRTISDHLLQVVQ